MLAVPELYPKVPIIVLPVLSNISVEKNSPAAAARLLNINSHLSW